MVSRLSRQDRAITRNERRRTAAMERRNRFIEIDGAGYV